MKTFQVHDRLSVDLSPLFLWSSVLHVGYCFAYPCNLSVFPLSIQFFTAMRYLRVYPSIFNNYPQLRHKQLQSCWHQLTIISGSLVSLAKVQLCLQLHYQYQEISFKRKYEKTLNILQM